MFFQHEGWRGETKIYLKFNFNLIFIFHERYTGGLSVEKFLKKLTWQKLSKESQKYSYRKSSSVGMNNSNSWSQIVLFVSVFAGFLKTNNHLVFE